MTDDVDRVDLSSLDAASDAARLDRVAGAVAARVAPSLRMRRERPAGLWQGLAAWRRPVMAGAVVVGTAAIVVLVLPRPRAISAAAANSPTLSEAMGLPSEVAQWLEQGTPPSNEDLLGVQESTP